MSPREQAAELVALGLHLRRSSQAFLLDWSDLALSSSCVSSLVLSRPAPSFFVSSLAQGTACRVIVHEIVIKNEPAIGAPGALSFGGEPWLLECCLPFVSRPRWRRRPEGTARACFRDYGRSPLRSVRCFLADSALRGVWASVCAWR